MDARQGTALTLKMGPFLDSTDGDTEETGLSIPYTAVFLSKNGGTRAAKIETTAGVHDSNGYYTILLGTGDVDTLGNLHVSIHISGALPVWENINVLTPNDYDSKYSTDYKQVDIVQVNGTAQVIADFRANVSSLATATNLQTVDDNIDILIARITAARAGYLDNLSAGAVALASSLSSVEGIVAAIQAVTDNIPNGGNLRNFDPDTDLLETGYTYKVLLRCGMSVLVGTSNADKSIFYAPNGTTPRVTYDFTGDYRSGVTLDGTT